MKKKVLMTLTLISMLLMIWGCSAANDEEAAIVSKVVLTADKLSISANGSDESYLKVKVYDQNENLMENEAVVIYNQGEIYNMDKFSTTIAGDYTFIAKCEGIESEELKIFAIDISPRPETIEFKSDLTSILADGTEKVTFTVDVFDQYGDIYSTQPAVISYSLGDSETVLTTKSFSTKIPGEYKFRARCGNVISEEITIVVPELIKVLNISKIKDYSEVIGLDLYKLEFEISSSSITKLTFSENTLTSPYEAAVSDKKAKIDKLAVDSSLKTITVTAYNSRNRAVGNSITVKLKN